MTVNDYRIRILYAIGVLILWNRFLYFFRVFRSMGFYIRMLYEVIKDIGHFLFILGVVYAAFAHAFILLGRNNSSGALIEDFGSAYFDSYLITNVYADIFGDFRNGLSWIIFLLSTIITNIILMNLLISIV